MRIGLVSDTHGLLRPEAAQALAGCDQLLHAGDIGDAAIIDALAALAPLAAVRGNNDHGPWADRLPEAVTLALGGVRIHLLHDLAMLAVDPRAERIAVVVSGHSHRPLVRQQDGVCYVNPGSAGPRRFSLPVAVAMLDIDADGRVQARTVDLLPGAAATRRRA